MVISATVYAEVDSSLSLSLRPPAVVADIAHLLIRNLVPSARVTFVFFVPSIYSDGPHVLNL